MMNAPDTNQIVSYREMCDLESQQQLQRGMNFEIGAKHLVILMSVKKNSPYKDRISDDGLTIYYEGHDAPGDRLKELDQPGAYPSGRLMQNGLFASAVDRYKKSGKRSLVRIYEKLQPGVWNNRGLFELKDYQYLDRGGRKVYEFVLSVVPPEAEEPSIPIQNETVDIEQTRQIPGSVKVSVYKRDAGKCVECGSTDNLHFDHILPYSKGGTSLKEENIRLLCARHNLKKSAKLDSY